MKILHTADWHAGRAIRRRSRAEEQHAVFAEIAAVAHDEAVELIIIAGDLFDTAAPTAETEQLVYEALLRLVEKGAHVVIVSGNHDNPRRLQAIKPLLELTRVHTGALLARPGEGGLIEIVTPSGETAQVALVPFLSQRGIVRADDLMQLDADQHAGLYRERMRAIVDSLCAGFRPDRVTLVAAHLMVDGGMLGGGEREGHTIFDYAVPASIFPATAHYTALGHLHRAQKLRDQGPVWYSGSPLQLDFGETENPNSVTIVEASPGVPARVRQVPLSAGRKLRTLRGALSQLEALAGETGDAWLRVVVDEPGRAGLADEVRDLFPNAVDVRIARAATDDGAPGTMERLDRSPRDLFQEFLDGRKVKDPRLLDLFSELLEETHAAEAP